MFEVGLSEGQSDDLAYFHDILVIGVRNDKGKKIIEESFTHLTFDKQPIDFQDVSQLQIQVEFVLQVFCSDVDLQPLLMDGQFMVSLR